MSYELMNITTSMYWLKYKKPLRFETNRSGFFVILLIADNWFNVIF